jgi:NAD(P)-dependent dehydrogenase (short-subunit alcohol dehydrogenase family)
MKEHPMNSTIKSQSSKKVALVTGASSGIGRSTVKEFAKHGWQVVATMRSPEQETELGTLPGVQIQRLDVTDRNSIQSVIDQITDQFGRIDVLVNNAGYGLMGPFEETSPAQIEKQFATNVFGLMNVTRAVLPLMRSRQSGSIINISSIGGRIGIPLYSSYHATKFAVEGFSESLAFELKPFGIDVVLIEPGAIATEFIGRSADFAKPAEESPYKPYFERVLAKFMVASTQGSSPDVVARKIVATATTSSPKLRNPIGGGAEILMMMRKILPDWALKGLVRQQTAG